MRSIPINKYINMSESIVKNSIYNIASKGFNVIYPIITSAYISRIFQAEGVGLIMYAINIVTYFSLAASLGAPNYAVKVLAPLKRDRINLNKNFTEIAIIIALSSLLASFVYYAIVPFVFDNSDNLLSAALVLGLIVVTNIFNYDWLFESMEDFKYLALRSIFVKCILLAAMFLLVKTHNDIIIYCGIYAGISVLNNIWNVFSVHRYVSPSFSGLQVFRHLRPISFLFAAAFATEVYTLLDSTMLGALCEASSLGYYSNASRVVRCLYGALFAVVAVFNPRLSKYYGIGDIESYKRLFEKYYDIGILLAVPATVLLFCMSSFIINILFGSGFDQAILILQILSPLIIVFMLATIFGHIPLVIYGKEKILLFATVVGAVLNFTLNQILIPSYQHNGAAIASIISEFVVTTIMIYYSLNTVKIPILTKHNTIVVVISTISMLVVYKLLDYALQFSNIFVKFTVLGFISIFIYFLTLLILKHSVVYRLKEYKEI